MEFDQNIQVGLRKYVFKSLDINNLVLKSLICFNKNKVGLAFTMHFMLQMVCFKCDCDTSYDFFILFHVLTGLGFEGISRLSNKKRGYRPF